MYTWPHKIQDFSRTIDNNCRVHDTANLFFPQSKTIDNCYLFFANAQGTNLKTYELIHHRFG